MNLFYKWGSLFIGLWIQVSSVPAIHGRVGNINYVSQEDVLLLKDEQNPKCFTRTQYDFTCFFETSDNRTYDLFYIVASKKRCEMSVQRTIEGTFRHICSFPAMDIFLYVEIHIDVRERNTNTSFYKRTVSVEDHFLLDSPSMLSLHHENNQAGQLQVSWQAKAPKYFEDNMMYMIRYSSTGLGEKLKQAKEGDILESLIPGDEVQVQVRVKCALNPSAGHWSSWSQPIQAVVPQTADDISMMCYTSDLRNIICQWNGSRYGGENEYKLFYKMALSSPPGWTEWTECLAARNWSDLCSFQGDESRKVRVKLCNPLAPLSRTFYTQDFTLNMNIKTSPPSHVRRALEKDKLCLTWEAPLPLLSAHLQYEVNYRIRGWEAWMMVSLKGPETATCVDVPLGSQYCVKIRAKPTGSIYTGHWSDWSDLLTGETPADKDTILMLCIPFSILITTIILITFFPKLLSKFKLYFWPPVPNLDKVLQGYLAEMNGQQWNPPLTAKQCPEETTPSVVEVMSETEVLGLGKPSDISTQPLSAERSFSSQESVDGSPEFFPDYVTLSKENTYVYKHEMSMCKIEGPTAKDEPFKTCLHTFVDESDCSLLCFGEDFLNHSYLPLAEPTDSFTCKVNASRRPGNLYSNLPCS